MSFTDLTKAELVRMLELIELAANCADPAGMKGLLLESRDLFEADYSICGLVKSSVKPEVAACINGSYPEQMLKEYLSGRHYQNDPVVKHAARYSFTQSWDETLRACGKDAGAEGVIRLASDFGLRHGLASGIYLPDLGLTAVFSYGAGSDRFRGRHRKMMDALALHFNNALLRALGTGPRTGAALDQIIS